MRWQNFAVARQPSRCLQIVFLITDIELKLLIKCGSQTCFHIRITWGSFKNSKMQATPPEQSNLSFWSGIQLHYFLKCFCWFQYADKFGGSCFKWSLGQAPCHWAYKKTQQNYEGKEEGSNLYSHSLLPLLRFIFQSSKAIRDKILVSLKPTKHLSMSSRKFYFSY